MICKKGIDVSKWQGDINWNKVKNDGVEFVIIRAGYSTTIDAKFKTNIEGALKAGINVGVYWFSYAIDNKTLKKEYEKCIETLKPYKSKIKYPVFFDLEYSSIRYAKKKGVAITKTLASNMAKVFLKEIKKAGYIPGVYTNIDFSNNYFTSEVLNDYDIWIAQYRNECTYKGKYTMWQHSEKGSVSGITGNVDLNYCYKEYVSSSNKNVKLLQQALNRSYNAGLVEDGLLGIKTQSQIRIHYLKKVTKNEHAKIIQTFLKELGYNIKIDSSYGSDTESIIKKFQKAKGLKVDGYCGINTHKAIIKCLG